MSAYEPLVRSAALALAPLTDALADRRACAELLGSLGWEVTLSEEALSKIRAVVPVLESLQALPELIDALDAGPTDRVAAVAKLVELVNEVVAGVKSLASLDVNALAGLPGNLASPEAWADIAAALPEQLFGRWLEAEVPALLGVMRLLGICFSQPTGRGQRYRFRWDRLADAFADPAGTIASATGWGGAFQGWAIQQELGLALARLGLPVRVRGKQQAVADAIAGAPGAFRGGLETEVVFFSGSAPGGLSAEVGLVFACTTDQGATLYFGNLASGNLAAALALNDAWSLAVSGNIDGMATIGVKITPAGLALVAGPASLKASIALAGAPAKPWILIGAVDGTRIELDAARIELGVEGTVAEPEAHFSIVVGDGALRFILDLGGADSFLRSAIGKSPAIEAGGTLRWGTRSGLTFSGGAGLDVTIPLGRQVGPLAVDSLSISLGASEDGARLAATVVGGLVIGPLVATVEGIGAALALKPEPGGNMPGGLGAELALVPPTGLGIGVDAEGIITGGGFISLDAAEGRYAGVVTLQMLSVGLTAIGIVETKLKDDPDGWSLFLSVMADFTPIQLGFGFMLTGVGGFMGLHRTFDQDALAEGAREGRLDSLLFPEDPLADAVRILADINAYFPTQTGTHAFGAMARIVWGVPTIVSAELGVILTVPDFEIALVGEIEALLPDASAPLLELHMSVIGYVDVAGGTFWIAASIYDSKLVGQHLSGDMAMYLALGREPYFLLSVGGFHPEWEAPASIPSSLRGLRRMSAAIDLGESFQAGFESYFAITSNTLQFGAELWAVAGARALGIDFTAQGWFGFDVLIVVTPFSITAGMDAGVTIKAEGETLLGVQLSLRVEGPKPWFATGRAEFQFLGFPVEFRVEVGDRLPDEAQDRIDLWPILEAALKDSSSWVAPAAVQAVPEISLRELDAVESGTWLAPEGALEVRQHLLPLAREIEIYGELVPSGAHRFDIEAAGLAPGVAGDWAWVEDLFAPAQYTKLKPAERLAAPSFESMRAGASIGATGLRVPNASADLTSTALGYQERVLEDEATTVLGVRALPAAAGLGVLTPVKTGLKPGARRAVAGVETLSVSATRFAVVDALTAAPLIRGGPTTFADAVVARRTLGASTRIVPNHSGLP